MKRHLFSENPPLALFFGYLIATIIYLFLDDNYLETWSEYFVYLVSAGITLFAAGLAWASAQKNINAQTELAEQRRLGSLSAAKSVLPLALSRFVAVVESGIKYAVETDDFFADSNNFPIVKGALGISEDTIKILKDCIEYSDPGTRRWISVLLAQYQVSDDRLTGRIEDPNLIVLDVNRESSVIDWLIVRALTDNLFDFARGAVDSVGPKLDLELIRMPLSHPEYNHPIVAAAIARLDQSSGRFGDGSIEYFELN